MYAAQLLIKLIIVFQMLSGVAQAVRHNPPSTEEDSKKLALQFPAVGRLDHYIEHNGEKITTYYGTASLVKIPNCPEELLGRLILSNKHVLEKMSQKETKMDFVLEKERGGGGGFRRVTRILSLS